MSNDENLEHLSEHEKDLERLEKLRLIDDDFFSEVQMVKLMLSNSLLIPS